MNEEHDGRSPFLSLRDQGGRPRNSDAPAVSQYVGRQFAAVFCISRDADSRRSRCANGGHAHRRASFTD